ncbi:hypothetical protein SLS54_003523 [Diplodia seriata]
MSQDTMSSSSTPDLNEPFINGPAVAEWSKKRQRPVELSDPPRNDWESAMEALERRLEKRIDEALANVAMTIVDRVNDRLDRRLAESEAGILDHVRGRVQAAKADMQAEMDAKLLESKVETNDVVDETMAYLRDEMDGVVDAKLDRRILEVKKESADAIRQEMSTVERNVNHNIRQDIQKGLDRNRS